TAVPAGAAPIQAARVGFDAANWREYVKASVQPFLAYKDRGAYPTPWEAALADGFIVLPSELRAPAVRSTGYAFGAPPAFNGDGELYLLAYPHVFRYDGRYANQPWAQEFPDPTTGQVWDT